MEASLKLMEGDGEAARIAADPILSQINVRAEREGNIIEGDVPLSIIYTEDVPVDEDHAIEIRDAFRSEAAKRAVGTGQLTPVILAEVIDSPVQQLFIVDGFHRTSVAQEEGYETIDSRVRLNSTMDDVIDLRIQTAAVHREVRFARLVEWIDFAWQRTPWADRITPVQGFGLAQAGRADGPRVGQGLGLSAAEVKELQAWIEVKCRSWDLSASSVSTQLIIAQNADPELSKLVRERRGRHTTLEALTQQHLGVIANNFPGNYAMQRHIKDIVLNNNLSVPLTRGLVNAFKIAERPEETDFLLEDPKFISSLKPVQNTSPVKRRRTFTPPQSAEVNRSADYTKLAKEFLTSEVEVCVLSLENLLLRGRYMPNRLNPNDPSGASSKILSVTGGPTAPAGWKSDRIHAASRHLKDKTPALAESIVKGSSDIQGTAATSIVQRASRRVIKDTETGGLRCIEMDDNRAVELAMAGALRDEIRLHRNPEAATEAENAADSYYPPIDLLKILPQLDEEHRRMLILHGVFKLSPFIVGQVVQRPEATTAAALRFIGEDYADTL